eukprot:1306861-Pleurochrysis_carterae.AAC.1
MHANVTCSPSRHKQAKGFCVSQGRETEWAEHQKKRRKFRFSQSLPDDAQASGSFQLGRFRFSSRLAASIVSLASVPAPASVVGRAKRVQ